MKVAPKRVTVEELVTGFDDDGEGGVVGYDGRLDIRPPFQREFVYKEKLRNAVIESILNSCPLNVMYWADRGNDTYEVIDGQQRTISIAQYVQGDFSYEGLYFSNQPSDKKKQILEYNLMVYVCSGTDSEKLAWFETVNIRGVELKKQELRNAVYVGPWVSDAKKYFSQIQGPVHTKKAGRYLKGAADRQEYLEAAIRWISQDNIEDYMGKHQNETSAEHLWDHFEAVIDWVERCFPNYRKPMKGINWGELYDEYKNQELNPEEVEEKIKALIGDEEVKNQKGIYRYIFTRDEKDLNLRTFSKEVKQRVYENQNGKCLDCKKEFKISEMDADHIVPWSKGGKTEEDNCQVLCRKCNQQKGAK